jgi:hypothetical protein
LERKNYFVENLRKTLREDNNFIPKINKLAHALYSIYRLDVTTHPHPPHSEGLCSYMSGKKNNGSGIGFGFRSSKIICYCHMLCWYGTVKYSKYSLLAANQQPQQNNKTINTTHNKNYKNPKLQLSTKTQFVSFLTLHFTATGISITEVL